MKGLETGKTRIRQQVFAEIARLAYEGGDYADKLERLPFELIPGEISTYRDSIFLERAVIGERLRLAMGLPVQRLADYARVSDGIEAALSPESYYEKPLINVIKFACNKCPDNVVRITDGCQGCLEHPCMEVCPKGAIFRENGQTGVYVYNGAGDAWIIQGDQDGVLHMFDGRSGAHLSELKLDGRIDASPAVYKNMLVVGTCSKGGAYMYGIKIE